MKRTAVASHQAAAVRKGSFPPRFDPSVPLHTLLLGTQPSDNSLAHGQYFMTNENCFWHIVGDALGFRRGFHIGKREQAPEYIRPHLMHDEAVSYDEAMRRLLSRGYGMWDIVASSVREGSLDTDIKEAEYADVPGFAAQHPTLERIVFSTGAGSARIFLRAHKESAWLQRRGAFRAAPDEASEAVFGAWCAKHGDDGSIENAGGASAASPRVIELCVVESVSPASNPRQTWSAAKQRVKNAERVRKGLAPFDDPWVARPSAVYPWKRADWFGKVFAREPAVMRAPKLGELDTHFRPRDEAADEHVEEAAGGPAAATAAAALADASDVTSDRASDRASGRDAVDAETPPPSKKRRGKYAKS